MAPAIKRTGHYAEPLLVAGPGLSFPRGIEVAAGEIVRLPFVKQGEWNFRDSYGPVNVTDSDLDTIVSNFQNNARRQDIPLLVNEEHSNLPDDADPQSYVGPGAVGWFKNMERQGDTVYVDVELNRLGEQIYKDDRYRGVSPELLLRWVDPETDQDWGKTAAGLAFTTMPRMKGLAKQGAPLYASEPRVLAFAEPMLFYDDSQPRDENGRWGSGGGGTKGVAVAAHDSVLGSAGWKKERTGSATQKGGADSWSHPDHPGHRIIVYGKGSGGASSWKHTDSPDNPFPMAKGEGARSLAQHLSVSAAEINDSTNDNDVDVRDVKECPTCDGTKVQNGGPCPTCQGTGKVDSQMNPYVQPDNPGGLSDQMVKAADLSSVHIDAPMKNLSVAVAVTPNKLSTARPSMVTGNKAGDGPPDNVGDVYAFPEQKRLPLNTAAGVTGAMARFMNIEASEQERETAWTRVITAGQHYGVKVPVSWRDLKASECVRWLMQESDEQSLHGDAYARMEQAFKDLIGQEVGEGEPDDVGFLAAKWQEINGWWQHELTEYTPQVMPVPDPVLDLALAETRATPDLPDSPAIPHEQGAAVTMDPVTPTSDPVVETPVAAPAPAPAPQPEPVKVSAGEKALVAELSETKALLSAERTGRLDALRKLDAAETTIANLKDASRKRETAEKMVKVTDRLDNLVKTGRITPAVRDQYAEHVAAFAESDSADVMLKGLEMLPANSAVDLREKGTSNEPPKGQNEGQRLEIAAHALMSEKGQAIDPKSKDYLSHYKDALIHVSKSGFQG